MIKSEILAPAGNIETIYAGINAGADAIYIGGQKFGARAYAKNLEEVSLLHAIDYVHINDKKLYLTVNTLLKNSEIEQQLFDYLKPLYEQGLDAVIVQDLGVFNFIKENFPLMDIHASTQMAISGINSAKLLKSLGASRIVTARELSLNELSEIHKNVDIEIESFIHGAMCYSYSGMCLFSSIIGGRSGNRGRCAGPCRQPYEVYEDEKRINNNNSLYALSLKDMNTLEIIPKIIESGVYSLKIEGRMKSPEYAAGVVSIYRKYIDLYNEYGSDKYIISKNDLDNLADLYSRSGSTTGYYKTHNSKKMISLSKPAYKTENDNYIEYINSKYCNHKLQKEVNASVKLHTGSEAVFSITDKDINVSINGDIIDKALNRPMDEKTISKQFNKTGDSLLKFHNISINMDDNIFIPLKNLNELRRQAIAEFENKFFAKFRRTAANEKKAFNSSNIIDSNTNRIICSINTLEQLNIILQFNEINDIYISTDLLNIADCKKALLKVKESGKNAYITMPFIFRNKDYKYMDELISNISSDLIDGIVIRNIDELGYVIEKKFNNFIIDSSLYSFNSYSYEFFKSKEASRITLPYELNSKELQELAKNDNELIVYGKIPLMISSNCLNNTFKYCDKKTKSISLVDRLGINFTVLNCCNFCYNIIYNNVPLSLLGVKDKMGKISTHNFRLNFTTESDKETNNILEKYLKVFYYNESSKEDYEFTRGHFKRGVE